MKAKQISGILLLTGAITGWISLFLLREINNPMALFGTGTGVGLLIAGLINIVLARKDW